MTDPTLTPTEDQLAQIRLLGQWALRADNDHVTDAELVQYFQLAGGNVRVAAADALQAVAASMSTHGEIRTSDLATKEDAAVRNLLALADRLRAQGRAEQDAADDDGFGFGIAFPTTGRTGPELTQRQVWGL